VHEPPTAEKADQLRGFLSRFNVSLEEGDRPTTHDYQEVISQLREKKNSHVLQMALLRSMNQAVYQPENKGHFGLGYKEYAHFTSPIRRFPDLLMHRLIKSVIHSRTLSDWILRFGKPAKASYYPYEKLEVIALGEHTSFVERRADAAVYEVLEWIKCDYMSDRVGDIHDGVITGVAKFGFFVELVDVFVEGLIHVSTLAGDYYQYDQPSQTLVGERAGATYGMGDTVSVQVARVNVTERKMDFELISHTPLTSRRKGSEQSGGKGAKDKSGSRGKPKSKAKAADKRPTKNTASGPSSEAPASGNKPRRKAKAKAKPANHAAPTSAAPKNADNTGAAGTADGASPKAKSRRRRRR
jgi:ribonuclease R